MFDLPETTPERLIRRFSEGAKACYPEVKETARLGVVLALPFAFIGAGLLIADNSREIRLTALFDKTAIAERDRRVVEAALRGKNCAPLNQSLQSKCVEIQPQYDALPR